MPRSLRPGDSFRFYGTTHTVVGKTVVPFDAEARAYLISRGFQPSVMVLSQCNATGCWCTPDRPHSNAEYWVHANVG